MLLGASVSWSGRSVPWEVLSGTGNVGAGHFKSVFYIFKNKNKLTQRRSGERWSSTGSGCPFSICVGGSPTVQVTMIPSDHVEIAIHQDDIRGAPNTVGWSHEVWCKFCPVQVFISVLYKAG